MLVITGGLKLIELRAAFDSLGGEFVTNVVQTAARRALTESCGHSCDVSAGLELAGCHIRSVFLTVADVQLLPRDTHWPVHHWQPFVFAVQL